MRVVALALVACSAAGCRFSVHGSADLATTFGVDASVDDLGDVGDLPPLLDLALPDLTVPGVLSGTRIDMPARVDLSAEGVVDWVHFGLAAVTDVNRKAGGPAAITMSAVGSPNQWSYYSPTMTWTSGAPTASASTTSGVFMYGANSGFSVTVPADTTLRTLRVYLSQYRSTAALVAHLSDGSASDFTMSTVNGGPNVYHCYTLSFRASHPAQTLRVTWTMTADGGGGTLDLLAATYY